MTVFMSCFFMLIGWSSQRAFMRSIVSSGTLWICSEVSGTMLDNLQRIAKLFCQINIRLHLPYLCDVFDTATFRT